MKKNKGRTNWEKVKQLTDADIEKAASLDSDNPILTDQELSEFRRVAPPDALSITSIRKQLNLNQKLFASFFGVSVRTLQEWEQGRRHPSRAALNFLWVIQKEPKAVQRALRNWDFIS